MGDLEFQPFNDDVLYRAEEARQLACFRMLQPQKSKKNRYAERQQERIYNIGDERFLWTRRVFDLTL